MTVFVAAMLSLLGVALLCWVDDGFVSTRGLLIVSVTIFSYSTYIVTLNKPIFRQIDSEVLTFYIMLFGSVIFFVYQLLVEGGLSLLPDIEAYGNILGLVLICTIISNLALVNAVRLAGSTITSILGSVEPVVATVIGIFYFDEPYGWNSLFGMLLIFLSVYFIVRMNSKQKEAEAKKLEMEQLE